MTSSMALVRFVRALRSEGIRVGPTLAVDLLRASELVGLANPQDSYFAFRCLSVTSYDQIPTFNQVFASFFSQNSGTGIAISSPTKTRTWTIQASPDAGVDSVEEQGDDGGDASAPTGYTGASGFERLASRDFAALTAAEVAIVRGLIAGMVWNPARHPSRRRRPSRSGNQPDLRQTLRQAVGPHGDLIPLATTEPRIKQRPLLFIADVSGSMERYSEMLLYFAHAARGRLGRLEAFVFSTRLTRITRDLSRRDSTSAITAVAETVTDWSGGTKIGEALATFNQDWSRRVTRGGPIVMIVSDGWDRGEPELLRAEMARLRRSVHRVVWLNPLAGRTGYSPETRGMLAALPYVDDFLPSANLSDLAKLVNLLESIPARRRI